MNKILDSLKHELAELGKARDILAYSYDKGILMEMRE